MLADTHRAWAVAWWLGVTLGADAAAAAVGRGPVVGPGAVLTGIAVAPLFSAGRGLPPRRFDRYGRPRRRDWGKLGISPDIDQRWAPGPPMRGYDWRGHRGWTHRAWFASVLTVVAGLVPFALAARAGVPGPAAAGVFAPVAGWWSHLSGDMVYGRLPVHLFGRWRVLGIHRWGLTSVYRWGLRRFVVGLGWETGGLLERGGRWWRDPAAGVCGALSVVLAGAHVVLVAHG